MTDVNTDGGAASGEGQPAPEELTNPTGAEAGQEGQEEGVEGGEDQSGEGAAAEGEEAQQRRRTAQDRINDLTREKHDARREADYWRGVAEGRHKPAETEQRQEQGHQQQADGPPDPNDAEKYPLGEFDPAYIADVADYRVETKLRERDERAWAEARAEQTRKAWDEQVAVVSREHPDFDTVVNGAAQRDGWRMSDAMAEAIQTSEHSARIAYHLGKNPDEARRIAGMGAVDQVRAIGRLEARFDKPAESQPQPKTVTDAPEPAPQARGQNGQFKVAPDTDDFAAFERQHVGRG